MLKNNLLKGSISSPHSCENSQADELGEYFLTLYILFLDAIAPLDLGYESHY